MVNKGLTKEEIFKACEELERRGEEPVSSNVREFLGTGSLTTISKYLKEWSKQKDEIPAPEEEIDLENLLSDVDPALLADYISNEHPQIIALVLTYLGPKKVASILELLEEDQATEILARMEKMNPFQKQVVQTIAHAIQRELEFLVAAQDEVRGGAAFVESVKQEMRK